jgi:hypothetical protein
LPRVEAEALRVRLVVACALREDAIASRVLTRWRALPNRDSGQIAGIERLARRCGY